ncbi:MAG: ROK family protein [Euzebyales bacterium]|nr:ROK family protein [Euzebyales bacterium]
MAERARRDDRRRRATPAGQRTVRAHNLALVAGHVARAGPASRARMAGATGLNKTTVSSLVAELIARGVLRETDLERPGAVGRPAVRLELDDRRWVGLGLEVNVSHVGLCVRDLRGEVRHEVLVRRDNRDADVDVTLADVAGLAADALRPLRAAGMRCAGATLAVPGLVDAAAGRLAVAPNLGWDDVAVGRRLHAALGAPAFEILVDNEANLGALAEHWDGAAADRDDVIYVSADIGVGGGIIVGGELQRGALGFGGEFGHIPVEPDGLPCACGRTGCLETRIGQSALLARVGRDPSEALSGADPRWPVVDLAAQAAAGDPLVLEALEEAGRWLGFALAGAANLLNPTTVVLGGFLGLLGDWLVAPVRDELARRVIGADRSAVEVRVSTFGLLAAVRGGAAVAIRGLLADPERTDRLERATGAVMLGAGG